MAGDFFEDPLEGRGDATGEVGVCSPAIDDGALALIELTRVNINRGAADFDVFEGDCVPARGLGEGEPLEGGGVVGRFVTACVGEEEGGREGLVHFKCVSLLRLVLLFLYRALLLLASLPPFPPFVPANPTYLNA